MKAFALLTLLLAAAASAKKFRLCACHDLRTKTTNDEYTYKLMEDSKGRFVLSGKKWTKDDGATYEGLYFHAIEGNVNGAEDDGWVGSNESVDLCVGLKPRRRHPSSACFTPNEGIDWRDCGSGCLTSTSTKTDGFGNPLP